MKKKKISKRTLIILGIVILSVAALMFVQAQNAQKNLIANTQTTTIQKGSIELVSIATGKISSANEETVKLVGTVSSLDVQLGDSVTQGDKLGVYSKQSLEAQSLLSPYSGTITQIPSALGSEFIISNANTLGMDVLIPEAQINDVKLYQYAEVYVQSVDTTFYGSISKINAYSATGSYTVRVAFDKGSTQALLGMSGVAKLNIDGYGDYYYHGKLSAGQELIVKVEGTMVSTDVKLGDTVKVRQSLGLYQARTASANIIAPTSGVISKLPGVTSTELTISDPSSLQLIVNISETDIHKLVLGQVADIYIESVDQNFEGSVVRIGQIGNTALDYTTYPVTIAFDQLDSQLFIGMSGSATIVVESTTNILIIPFEALITDGTQRYVLSAEWLNNSSKPQSDYYVPVTTGLADVYHVEVSGENLENLEIVIPEDSASFSLFQRP